MLFLLLVFVISILSIPLYLDYKKDPKNNIVINNLNIVSKNEHVIKVITPLLPHAKKYEVEPIFIFPAVVAVSVLVLWILLSIIF
jgi:hypothetical protein